MPVALVFNMKYVIGSSSDKNHTALSRSIFNWRIIFFSSLDMYDCEIPSLSATCFCVCSFRPLSPNLNSIIRHSRSRSFETACKTRLFSSSHSIFLFTVSGSLPRTSHKSSSLPSQSVFSGSSIDTSFFSCDDFRKNIRISFSIHLDA